MKRNDLSSGEQTPFRPAAGRRLNNLITLVLLLALFALLALASIRYPLVLDWTHTGRHSLSAASITVLDKIDGPVSVVSYAREQTSLRLAIERFIDRFRRVKPDIDLQFRNPDAVPDEVRELGISINGEMVVRYQGRSVHVREGDESAFINALIRLTGAEEKWIAFIEGHGERNPVGKANHDLGDFGKILIERGYRIRPLNLAEIGTIPDNTSVLVLAGPRVPMLEGETRALLGYLQRGGNLLWLLDPGEADLGSDIAAYLGVRLEDGTIIDIGGQLIGINDPTITMLTSSLYGQHPLLDGFSVTTLFPRAAALSLVAGNDWKTTPLLTTASHTWLETGNVDENSRFDGGADQQGPLTLGLAMQRTPGGTNTRQKIVMVADGDFLSNRFLQNAGNLDLGLRLVNWLSDSGDLLTIPGRIASDTQLNASAVMVGSIGIVFLLAIPLISILTGLTIWWRRKRS